jgi:hypothetical protein
MNTWSAIFLFLHIGSVIVAFGPTIAFPFFAARAASEPMHGNFVLRATEFVSAGVVEPVAVVVFLTGVGLILTLGYNPLERLWLAAAIVLFLITFTYANLVQARTVRRLVTMTSAPPPAGAEAGAGRPPAEFQALAAKAARGGQFMGLMLFVILALMVFKPTI